MIVNPAMISTASKETAKVTQSRRLAARMATKAAMAIAETHTELTHIWRDINEDPDIGAVIVTGAGKARPEATLR